MSADTDERGAAAKRWLESVVAKPTTAAAATMREVRDGGFFNAVSLWDLEVLQAHGGRALCSFRVPAHLADCDGNWHAGAMSTVIDLVGATAIMSTEGHLKVSAETAISYFSPAKIDEEVEIEARVLGHKGRRLSAVAVEMRKKGSGKPVALGKLWMASGRPLVVGSRM